MNTEGRAAIAEFLAALTTFHIRAKALETLDETLANLELQKARVQVTCSSPVAARASQLLLDAALVRVVQMTEHRYDLDTAFRMRGEEANLIDIVRRELKLGPPDLPHTRPSGNGSGGTQPPYGIGPQGPIAPTV